jgi:hypothetical protein
MHESDRNRLRKTIRWLLFAASDMAQAEAAVVARRNADADNFPLCQALETAIAVCYGRAFTSSNFMKAPPEYIPQGDDSWLHDLLVHYRDTRYAHTDKRSGRDASLHLAEPSGDVSVNETWTNASVTETLNELPEVLYEAVVELAQSLNEQYWIEAERLTRELKAADDEALGD